MANVVLGFASSHAPQLRMPASQWPTLLEKDRNDPRYDYEDVLSRARPDMDEELTPEVMQRRDEANHDAMASLRAKLLDAKPDAIMVVGDDQHEQSFEDNLPMFSVYYGASLPVRKRGGRDSRLNTAWGNAAWRAAAEGTSAPGDYPAQPDLAAHVIDSLVEQGFDISCTNQLRADVGVGHAFSFLYQEILPEGNIPVVPVMVNAFFPPNRPTPRRCFQLGQALREGIEAWRPGKRVAVMASGGLSHFIIDEGIDHMALEAMQQKDIEAIATLPRDRLMVLGTGEILNWIVVAGAMEREAMNIVDYAPCYRTPAGTGCAMAFAYWE